MALPGTAPLALDVAIEGVQVCVARRRGRPTTRRRWPQRGGARRGRVRRSGCPATAHETEVFFSDLGHEYVTINAEYTT